MSFEEDRDEACRGSDTFAGLGLVALLLVILFALAKMVGLIDDD